MKSGFLAYQYLGLDQELRHQLRHAGHYWLEQCFSNVSPIVAVDFGRFISQAAHSVFYYHMLSRSVFVVLFGYYDSLKSTRFIFVVCFS